MRINGIGVQGTNVNGQKEVKSNDTLDVNDFLKILTAQLQHMDPLGGNSSDPTEYINQMTQFTMLEQMNNLVSSIGTMTMLSQQQMSFSLVGKEVSIFDGEERFTGIVEKVRYREGVAYPVVNGVEYPMGYIEEIGGKEDVL